MVKRFLLLLLLTGFFFFSSYSQQWYREDVAHGRDVSASAIPNSKTFILGAGFEVAEEFEDYFLTTDFALGCCGGWNVAVTDTPTSQVKSIVFKDSLNGYAACYHGKVVRTFDGGLHWYKVDTLPNKNFFKIIAVTKQILYIAGGARTQDSATVYKSIDGGDTWAAVYNQPGRWLKSVCFLDTLKGFAVGDSSQIIRTNNGGVSWAPVISPVADRDLNGIVFINANTGYIIGGKRDLIRTIFKTVDGGANWTVLKDEPGGGLNDVTFINQNEGYIVGDSATVLKTTDGGQTWVPQILPNTNADQRINTVSFYNSSTGVIGGMGAYVEFYTFSSVPEVNIAGAVMRDSVTASLYTDINTHGHQGMYTFYYSPDSSFATFSGGQYPLSVISNSFSVVEEMVSPVIPDTTYYYFVQVSSLAGIVVSEKKSFFTHMPDYTFKTIGASSNNSTSITFTGEVDKLPSVTNLYFEYGTTNSLGSTIAAVPAVVSDTLKHTVSATLDSVVPLTTYFYRLMGTGNGQNYYGTINSFMAGTVFSNFMTLPATNIGTNSATLNGSFERFNLPVSLSFEYDTNPQFGQTVPAMPAFVDDALPHTVSANITNLLPLVQYYYRVKGHTSLGDYYGGTMSFALGLFSQLETKPASDISGNSVTLNGAVNGFQLPATLSFEYSTMPGFFIDSIPATPADINDTLQHSLSATLSGLNSSTPYYFRIKAHTAIGDFTGSAISFNLQSNNPYIPPQSTIKVYPNPTRLDLTVELVNWTLRDTATFKVADMYGKICKELTFPSATQSASLNISDLVKGIYIIYLHSDSQGWYAKKFVVD